MLTRLLLKARMSASNAEVDGFNIKVSDINEYGEDLDTVKYFVIEDEDESYVVYQIMDDIYYRDGSEFFQIMEDIKDEVPGQTIESLKVEYTDVSEPLTSYPITDIADCLFIISSIFSSMTGESYDVSDEMNLSLNESAKIRRSTKLGTDNDIMKSKKVNDIKYGSKDENDFKQEIEDKQKKDGTIGALDQQQEETVKPKLPNVNLISEKVDIEYEINDKVIYNDEYWHVFAVTNTVDDQRLKITREGKVIDVSSTDVKPDPEQLKNLEIDNQFEFDKNNLNKSPKNDKVEKMKDLNDPKVNCNIVVDNTILTQTTEGKRFKANLKDILEGEDLIRVYVDDDNEQHWNKENIQIDNTDWPYAVIASETDEPLRKIRVNPLSYINAKEDNDLVDCIIGDKQTQLPKRAIRILS